GRHHRVRHARGLQGPRLRRFRRPGPAVREPQQLLRVPVHDHVVTKDRSARTGSRHDTGSLPDIVLVVFDTARRDRFGCYGYGRPTTPTTDSLAGPGIVVDTMLTNAPWTLPSHASLFTGLYPSQHRAQWQTGRQLGGAVRVTMGEALGDAGKETICATSNGLISSGTGLARGFDDHVHRSDLESGWNQKTRQIEKVGGGGDAGGPA